MKIKTGDTILVISGRNKGKKGKVIKALIGDGKIFVEGINLVKKHRRPRKSGEKGQIVEVPSAMNISKIMLICPKCAKPTRVGHQITMDKKYRVCKKCKQEI